MRKLFYLGILLLVVTHARAQENRGFLIPAKIIQRSVMVGGSVAGSYRSVNNTTGAEPVKGYRQQLDADIKGGYFIYNDLAVGIRASVYHYKQVMDNTVPFRTTNLLAGPFVRYYLNNGFFGEASAAAGVNNQPGKPRTDVKEVRGGIGYAIFINPKVSVEPAILVSYYQETIANESNPGAAVNKLSEIGPTLNLGLQVYLFRERKFMLNTPR